MKTRLFLTALLLASFLDLPAASSATQKISALAAQINALQNQVSLQGDGPSDQQLAQLNTLLTNLNAARQDANNAVNNLNSLLSQAHQQNVGGLPQNIQLQGSSPNIADGIPPTDEQQIKAAAKAGDLTKLAQLAAKNSFAIEEVTQWAVEENPDLAATLTVAIIRAYPNASADKIAKAATVAATAAWHANANEAPYQVSLIAAAVAQEVPTAATQVAASVAKVVPNQAAIIAVAVSTDSPGKAAEIAAAVAKEVPSEAAKIAGAVMVVAPAASQDIVNEVTRATNANAGELSAAAGGVAAQVKADIIAWGQGASEAANQLASPTSPSSPNPNTPSNTTTPQPIDPSVISRSS